MSKASERAYYLANRERLKELRLMYRYGLSLGARTAMLASQDGKCAICQIHMESGKINVDHNHVTGKVRGLVCTKCNRKLVGLEDVAFLERAVEYLCSYEEQVDLYKKINGFKK